MAKIDVSALRRVVGTTGYPAPYDREVATRVRRALGDAAGLTQFGVNLLELPPGAWSSQRHWHSHEDELVFVLQGEIILLTEAGETVLKAGDCAGFKAGDPDGHHLRNMSERPALILEIGSRCPGADVTEYPDIDLRWTPDGGFRKDGTRV